MNKRAESVVDPKVAAARKFVAQRFHGGFFDGESCAAILDLLTFACKENPAQALKAVPGMRSGRSHRIKNPVEKGRYGRVHWFLHAPSGMKVSLASEPIHLWLWPFRITLIANDRTGLRSEDVFSVLELMPGARLLMMELALDFSATSGVTDRYVRLCGVFGKSLRDRSMKNPSGDWWGTRNGQKRVKSYFKPEVFGHRLEWKVKRSFLKEAGITTPFDFWRFQQLLPRRHVLFARIDEPRLVKQLRAALGSTEAQRIFRTVTELEGDLVEQMAFLRQVAGLTNTRRLLVPLRTNRLIRDALRAWARSWPKEPLRLGKAK